MTTQSNHRKTGQFSPVVAELLSAHIQTSYPKLVQFIESALQFLERSDAGGYHLNRIRFNRDVDMISDDLLTNLQQEFGNALPKRFAAEPRLFYKRVIDIYRSRGTEQSINAFFRLLYNDNVEIHYPKDDLLVPSDGRYSDISEQIIESPENHSPIYTFAYTVNAVASGAFNAGVKSIDIASASGISIGDKITVGGSDLTITAIDVDFDQETGIVGYNRLTLSEGLPTSVSDNDTMPVVRVANRWSISFESELRNETITRRPHGFDQNTNLLDPNLLNAPVLYHRTSGVRTRITDWTLTTTSPGKGVLSINRAFADTDVLEVYDGSLIVTNDGFLNDRKRIQDSLYYQQFSYVVRTGVDVNQWRDPFSRLIHPAGFQFFGELQFITTVDASPPLLQPGRQTQGLTALLPSTTGNYISLFTADEDIVAGSHVTRVVPEARREFNVIIGNDSPSVKVFNKIVELDRNKFRFTHTPLGNFDPYTIEDAIDGEIQNFVYAARVTTST